MPRCRHPRPARTSTPGGWRCERCGHVAASERIVRGRRARALGRAKERSVLEAAGLRVVGGAGGPEDGVSERYVAQVKSVNPARYPGWILEALDVLRSATVATDLAEVVRAASAGRLPVLFVAENPGRGRKARDTLAIMRLADWLVATGGGAPDA